MRVYKLTLRYDECFYSLKSAFLPFLLIGDAWAGEVRFSRFGQQTINLLHHVLLILVRGSLPRISADPMMVFVVTAFIAMRFFTGRLS